MAVMSLGMASGNLLGGQVISVADVRSVYGVAVLPALMAFSLYLVSHLRGQKVGEAAEI